MWPLEVTAAAAGAGRWPWRATVASERERWWPRRDGLGKVAGGMKGGGSSVTGEPGFEPGLGCSLMRVQSDNLGTAPSTTSLLPPSPPRRHSIPSSLGLWLGEFVLEVSLPLLYHLVLLIVSYKSLCPVLSIIIFMLVIIVCYCFLLKSHNTVFCYIILILSVTVLV